MKARTFVSRLEGVSHAGQTVFLSWVEEKPRARSLADEGPVTSGLDPDHYTQRDGVLGAEGHA